MSWDEIDFMNQSDDKMLWSIKRPNGDDLALGLVLGAVFALRRYIDITGEPFNYSYFRHYRYDRYENVEAFTTYGPFVDRDVNVIKDRDYKNVIPKHGKLGIWIKLDQFTGVAVFIESGNMDEFLQGFITMFNAFNINFRDLLLGSPYDSNGTEYQIINY